MVTHNFETLRRAVIAASVANGWAQAVVEWQVVGVEKDPSGSGVCVCGKTELVYLYTIHNRDTGLELFPIGSSCVNLFEVEELTVTVGVLRGLFELRAAFMAGKDVTLTVDFFSRATLADLWQSGAFPPNKYNRYNGDNDYKFLLDLFNQRHEFTEREERKVWVLLNRTIKTFVINDERLA